MMLVHMPMKDYLEVLGSDAPAPGGGSASALCGAQGAALLAMVAGLTLGKAKYAQFAADCADVREKTLVLAEKLQAQVDADTEAFNLVAAAFRMPKNTPEEKQARSAAIQAGTLQSTRVPFGTMELALEALKAGEKLLDGFNESAASDLGVAAWNLLTCVNGAWLNVCINISSLKDREAAENFRLRGEAILREAESIAQKLADHARMLIMR